MSSTTFKEIEHKFLVDGLFDRRKFIHDLKALSPIDTRQIVVRDTYYVLSHDKDHVFRHRYDQEIQQLTVKSIETDAAVRTEINIPIDQSAGDQRKAIAAFMEALGCRWSGEIKKEIDVAYFADCEVVFYRAVGNSKTITCVEFEAVNPASIEQGLDVLSRYEKALGFAARQRESKSLFELLLLEAAPQEIRRMFQ